MLVRSAVPLLTLGLIFRNTTPQTGTNNFGMARISAELNERGGCGRQGADTSPMPIFGLLAGLEEELRKACAV